MKRAIKKQSNLYAFLEPFLEIGNEEAIAQARKEYWKNYKQNWKKQNRKDQKTFEISFTKQEWQIIKQAANNHTRSYTSFIKQATLAYCQNTYLIPDQLAYNNIQQALTMLYNKLKDFEEDDKLTPQAAAQLLQTFISIENSAKQQLKHSQSPKEVYY